MLQNRYVPILLLTMLVVYFAQGALYATGSIISQLALFVTLGISGIYFIESLLSNRKNALFFYAWTALLVLNIFGFVFTGNLSNSYHFGVLKGILISSLPFYPIYFFSQRNMLSRYHLIAFLISMLPVSILHFYLNREQILLERFSDNLDVVNNVAYMFVNLIPFVFLIKKNRVISVIGMLILVFFIIQGAKRGAILTGVMGLILFIYYQLRTIEGKYRFVTYIISFIGTVVLVYFSYKFYLDNEYLIQRMQQLSEGGTSGRDVIYSNLFSNWFYSENLLNFIIGYGFAGSMKLSGTGNFAHNDWLELLTNYGLLGISIYGFLFYSAYIFIRNPFLKSDQRIIMITVVGMWFLVTLFSMGYTSLHGYSRAILLAYLVGGSYRGLV